MIQQRSCFPLDCQYLAGCVASAVFRISFLPLYRLGYKPAEGIPPMPFHHAEIHKCLKEIQPLVSIRSYCHLLFLLFKQE